MSGERKPFTSCPVVAAFVLSAPLATSARASEAPALGTVCELPVVSMSVAVGSTDRESKRVVYAPPPGWYVRSHRVVTANRSGTVTYSVSTVPAGWNWTSDERMAAFGRASGTAALALPHGVAAGGQVAGAQDTAVAGRQASTSSHHVLVVDVTAKGAGLWQGGGGVDLTVFADMVYLGR